MAQQVDIREEVAQSESHLDSGPVSGGSRHASESVLRRALPHLVALAFFTLLSIVATWPMFPQLGGYVMDKGDPLYSVWAMAWQAHALATNPFELFDTNVMYPFEGTLAFDELSFTEAVLAAPIYYLSGNPVLSHQTLLFATFVLSGYATWLLVRELTGSPWVGLVAGAAFAFSFYRVNHLPHMTLINTQWMPLVLLAAYKLLWTRSWKWAAALAGFFTLQALSGHYLAFYTAMLLCIFFAFYWLRHRSLFSWGVVRKLAAGMAASLLLMLSIAMPYALYQADYSFARSQFEAERFSNTLASFLAVFRGNSLYQQLLSPFADPGFWAVERSAFPGLAVLALWVIAAVGAWKFRARPIDPQSSAHARPTLRSHVIFYSIMALLSALLSLGPSLQLTYARDLYDPNAIQRIMPLPYMFLHDWVPGFQSMRVVSRIGVLTALALSVLAGLGVFYLLRWLGSRRTALGTRAWALPAIVVLIALVPVLESWTVPVKMEPVGTRHAVPEVYRWLAEQPRTVILEYPMTHWRRGDPSVEMANLYQYYSVYHWHHTVNGSTTVRPFAYSALVRETEDCFPCPRSLDALWALGVEYVVVHLENLSGPQREDFLWRAVSPEARVVDSFELVREFGPDRVYRLKPREIAVLKELVPPGASLLLDDPGGERFRQPGDLVYGGYLAALGFYLRDYELYGDPRLSFGQPIDPLTPENRPDYALLWVNRDPTLSGYLPGDRIWANEFVALYKYGVGIGGVDAVERRP